VQFTSLSYNEFEIATIDQVRMMKVITEADEKKRKKMMPGSTGSGSSSGAPPKYRMVYNPVGVNYADHNNSRAGATAHNSNHGNSSSKSSSRSSSTMLLLNLHSKQPLGHHSSFLPVTSHASTVGRWGTLLMNAASPSKATHCELRHPWSISRGAIKRVLCHELASPTTPPLRISS
jgi:hypothetical protein